MGLKKWFGRGNGDKEPWQGLLAHPARDDEQLQDHGANIDSREKSTYECDPLCVCFHSSAQRVVELQIEQIAR